MPMPNQVSLEAFSQNDFTFTRFITGVVTPADVGKAVAFDAASPASVKLAGDGDEVYGRIYQVENRTQEGVTTVTVERKFTKRLPIKAGQVVVVGGTVIGAGAGEVKPAVTPNPLNNIVLAIVGAFAIVEKL